VNPLVFILNSHASTQNSGLATSFLPPYASAAIILDGALQSLEAVAKPVLKRGVSASPSDRIFDIDDKVQYFAGTNAWWLGHFISDADLDTAMSEMHRYVLHSTSLHHAIDTESLVSRVG
jgi:hypothetical protein